MKYFIYATVIGAVLTIVSLVVGEAKKKEKRIIYKVLAVLVIASVFFSYKYERSKEIDAFHQNKKIDSTLVNTEKIKKSSSEIINNIERSLEDVSHLRSNIDSLNKNLTSLESGLKPQVKTEANRDKKDVLISDTSEKIKHQVIKKIETVEEKTSTKNAAANNNETSNYTPEKKVEKLGGICFTNTNFYSRKVTLTNKVSGKKETIIIGPAGAANGGKSANSCAYDLPQGIYKIDVYTTFSKKLIEQYNIRIIPNEEILKILNQNHYN